MTEPFWTDERIAEMKRLLQSGLSCGRVAGILRCSRNAVIGKVHRIEAATGTALERGRAPKRGPRKFVPGAPPRKKPQLRLVTEPQPTEAAARKPPPPPPRRAPPLPAGISAAGVKPVRIGRPCGILQASGCRWPIDSDPRVIGTHVFCNAAVDEGRSYCDAHARQNVAPYSTDLIRRTIKGVMPTAMPRSSRGYA
jgi:GcrA cell cycle regulator